MEGLVKSVLVKIEVQSFRSRLKVEFNLIREKGSEHVGASKQKALLIESGYHCNLGIGVDSDTPLTSLHH